MPTDVKTVWLIECPASPPAIFIAQDGGLTYQRHKAKHFATREEAEKYKNAKHLAHTWDVVSQIVSNVVDEGQK